MLLLRAGIPVHLRLPFFHALNESLKDELAPFDEPNTLNEFITLATHIDNHLMERRVQRNMKQPAKTFSFPSQRTMTHEAPQSSPPAPEPMQVGRTSLSSEERQRRKDSNQCRLWNPMSFHSFPSRTPKREGSSVGVGALTDQLKHSVSSFLLPSVLQYNNNSLPLTALINSGCEQNLIDQSTKPRLKLFNSLFHLICQPLMVELYPYSPTKPNHFS